MKLRLWPPLWMVCVPLRSVGVLPQPAVVAADAAGIVIVVTASTPAATMATAPSAASQRGTKRRLWRVVTTVSPSVMNAPR
jgi:hypothetical protein